jgi:hypothetical protein
MFIKLAQTPRCPEIDKILAKCCDHKGAHFIPLTRNVFGIAVDEIKLSIGAEDSSNKSDTTLLQFVDVYKCAKLHDIDYDQFIPDIKFFRNIYEYCKQNGIEIEGFVDSSSIDISEYEYLCDVIYKDDIKIKKLYLVIKNKIILINEFGYIDVAANYNFFDMHKDTITNLINAGLT